MKGLQLIFACCLVACLAPLPYGYFMFIRFGGLVLFGILSYQNFNNGSNSKAVAYLILALLFQPFAKVALGRELWNIVDVLVAIGLIVDVFSKKFSSNQLQDS